MPKSLMISLICLVFGAASAADSGDVVEINESIAPEAIESGLFPKSSITAACEEAAKAGFTCGRQIVPRKVFSLPSNISFASGSAQLSDAAKSLLAGFGPALKRNEASGSSVIFIGHTDITGSKRLNQNLSERRAEAVRQYFISNFEISPSFLKASGVGSAQLKDKGDPSSSVNRRVEISTTLGK